MQKKFINFKAKLAKEKIKQEWQDSADDSSDLNYQVIAKPENVESKINYYV